MYWYLPVIDIPQQNTGSEPVDLTGQVTFRATTTCPVVPEHIALALIAGLALGYLIWNR
jgi:hypothetical protein